ncbi:MAG: Uncharacterized protein CEO12_330 [Parcubacteria group bacterium Gr01-1014_46]|nr:MAG: Uncharacterized protein CEO12_330 [Parcubacteria group bacterium Gr01-1014_46]
MEKELNEVTASTDVGTKVVYEVSYLLLPTLSLEQVPVKVASVKDALVSSGATLISDEDPVLIDLAYSMTKVVQTNRHKADQGYFGWVKFEISKDSINQVKKFFDNNVDVLRHLIIKTVRENTLLNGKMKLKSEDKTKKFDDKSDEEAIDTPDVLKEEVATLELDKNIDDLVVV